MAQHLVGCSRNAVVQSKLNQRFLSVNVKFIRDVVHGREKAKNNVYVAVQQIGVTLLVPFFCNYVIFVVLSSKCLLKLQ